jgi:hypothetical protein
MNTENAKQQDREHERKSKKQKMIEEMEMKRDQPEVELRDQDDREIAVESKLVASELVVVVGAAAVA